MNKKLIKTLTCIAGITAIGSTVGIISTSCGSSSDTPVEDKALPETDYIIDSDSGIWTGMRDDIDWELYKNENYDTAIIPADVKFLGDGWKQLASHDCVKHIFFEENSQLESINASAQYAGNYITDIDFSNCTKMAYIQRNNFNDMAALTKLTFKGDVELSGYAFINDSNLNSIIWYDLTNPDVIDFDADFFGPTFKNCSPTGSVKVISESYTSEQLLDILIEKDCIPAEGWKAI